MKKQIKIFYRLVFYKSLKMLERTLRGLIFTILDSVLENFNSFRIFGIPRRVVSVEGKLVFSSLQIVRQPPKTIEAKIHSNFSPLQAHTCEGRVAVIPNGIATETAAHLTAKGELIQEFSQQFTMSHIQAHKLFTFRKNRMYLDIAHYNASVVSLTADGHWNYFHWLFDILPKLHLVQKVALPFEFLYASKAKPFQTATLKLLGFKESRIIDSTKHPVCSTASLILSSFPASGPPPFWVTEFLRSSFLPHVSKFDLPKRIFISRREAAYRRILNEEELLPVLQKAGFTILQPEKLSFVEQVAHFQAADLILSPHGAALANLVFCKPQAEVIEILPPRFCCSCYWSLSNAVSLNYSFFLGEDKTITYSAECLGYDHLWVDIEKIKMVL